MDLFDDIARCFEGPAQYSEPAFTFLNRSARPAADRARQLLDGWFSHYPPSEQADLRGRFRSRNDRHHASAFFELFLHQLLLNLEFEVQVHPDVEQSVTTRPDFHVTSRHGERFFIEAIVATDESDEDAATRARMNAVYDALNQLDSPNFFVGMNLEGAPDSPPSARDMRAFLEKRLSQLDPDEIASLWEIGLESIPNWHYHHDGWRIQFYPIPKSAESRGKPGLRPIGLQTSGRVIAPEEAIKDAILKKAGRYGTLDLPYVIAVNALSRFGVDHDDILDALLGNKQATLDRSKTGKPVNWKHMRKSNGAWTSEKGPRYTRVSAALIAAPVIPWNIPTAPIRLYHHPWATNPYKSDLTKLPQAIVQEDGRMNWVDGVSLGEIFGLHNSWPASKP